MPVRRFVRDGGTGWTAMVLGVALSAVTASPARAEPAPREMIAFSGLDHSGNRRSYGLSPQEKVRVYLPPSDFPIASFQLGKDVAVLFQRLPDADPIVRHPEYVVFPQGRTGIPVLWGRSTGFLVLYEKRPTAGLLPLPHPDGVGFSRYSVRTITGSGERPSQFHAPRALYPPGFEGYNARPPGWDMPFVQVYGKATYLKLVDRAGGEHVVTTRGEDAAEYDLAGHPGYRDLAAIEVGTLGGERSPGTVAGPAVGDSRTRWGFQSVVFQQYLDRRWVEFQHGQPRFQFEEVARTPDHVELLDASRQVRVRLQADRIGLMRPEAGPGFAPAYAGGGWQDGRDHWVVRPGWSFSTSDRRTWTEFQGDRPAFPFTEVRRTAEFVELHDASRRVRIRLHADRALLQQEAEPGQPWRPLVPGAWGLRAAP